jgi:biopolymer transport protein ExbB/TolQ
MAPIMAASAPDASTSFSMMAMIQHADPVVQAIAAMLVISSVACWAIMGQKIFKLSALKRQAGVLEASAAEGRLPGTDAGSLPAAIAQAARAELSEGTSPGESRTDVRARLERAMRLAMKGELREIERGLPFLATVGSAAPFVGLLGTVWGIMHAFTSIAQSKDTSLAVVAPGIAEALFVTALGLAAAIPAVIAYNQFSVSLGLQAERIVKSITAVAKALSRDDHDKVRPMKSVK